MSKQATTPFVTHEIETLGESMNKGFSTELLDNIIILEKKGRERLRLQIKERIFDAIGRLSGIIHFEEAYIFGSVAKPYRFLKDSDIDIAFIGLKDGDFFRAMSFISNEIGRDIDIVQLERHRLAEKIKREGIRWRKKV